MNKDEALHELKRIRFHFGQTISPDLFEKVGGALTMAIDSLEKDEWISCSKELPDENKRVLTKGRYGIRIAYIEKGITEETRQRMINGELEDPIEDTLDYRGYVIPTKRSELYRRCDEFGNNTVPYSWFADGINELFGQEVYAWRELPE